MVRPERPDDVQAIYAVHAASFPTDAEARLVDSLRAAGRLSVSLVAEVDAAVVGHIAFSPVTAAPGAYGAGLAPVAGGVMSFARTSSQSMCVNAGRCREGRHLETTPTRTARIVARPTFSSRSSTSVDMMAVLGTLLDSVDNSADSLTVFVTQLDPVNQRQHHGDECSVEVAVSELLQLLPYVRFARDLCRKAMGKTGFVAFHVAFGF
jgi:hypothetical protein